MVFYCIACTWYVRGYNSLNFTHDLLILMKLLREILKHRQSAKANLLLREKITLRFTSESL